MDAICAPSILLVWVVGAAAVKAIKPAQTIKDWQRMMIVGTIVNSQYTKKLEFGKFEG